jgi:hypothetical protein
MPETEKVSEDQANEALQQIMNPDGASDSGVPQPQAETATEPPVEEAAAPPAETEAETPPAEEAAEVVETTSDDIESLRQEMREREERFGERLRVQQQRSEQNERILRDRFLQKSTAADRALKTLRATRTEAGVSEAEVDQVIRETEATMNPQSASYAPPQQAPAATDDQALILNNFLNERGMTQQEADEFGRWIQTDADKVLTPTETAVANESIGGFLHIAHGRWQEGIREKEKETRQTDAVGAVRSVQRTQREAARAASAPTTAPQKQPASPAAEPDVSKFTKDDVSALLRQSVQQYK